MKKNAVLFILFILPIVAYLFFASGINSFAKLPVMTAAVNDFGAWKSQRNEQLSLDNKITILGFGGSELLKNRGNLFNLNQKVYQRYHKFKDLQFVIICPFGTEKDADYIVTQFATFTDTAQWHFIFTTPEEIQKFHSNLKLKEQLDAFSGTPKVYIVDKERNLRGRKDESDETEGYSTFHLSELSNKMLDDFKVILYEYRAALKKNRNAERKI